VGQLVTHLTAMLPLGNVLVYDQHSGRQAVALLIAVLNEMLGLGAAELAAMLRAKTNVQLFEECDEPLLQFIRGACMRGNKVLYTRFYDLSPGLCFDTFLCQLRIHGGTFEMYLLHTYCHIACEAEVARV
jgi:hypothetical protein